MAGVLTDTVRPALGKRLVNSIASRPFRSFTPLPLPCISIISGVIASPVNGCAGGRFTLTAGPPIFTCDLLVPRYRKRSTNNFGETILFSPITYPLPFHVGLVSVDTAGVVSVFPAFKNHVVEKDDFIV